jgi:hypothetical protein
LNLLFLLPNDDIAGLSRHDAGTNGEPADAWTVAARVFLILPNAGRMSVVKVQLAVQGVYDNSPDKVEES